MRLKHFNSRDYVKPKMFDRWKLFVLVKRQFRYWLNFVDKRAHFVKSDLHQAFDKWRGFHPMQKNKLAVQSKAELNRKAV